MMAAMDTFDPAPVAMTRTPRSNPIPRKATPPVVSTRSPRPQSEQATRRMSLESTAARPSPDGQPSAHTPTQPPSPQPPTVLEEQEQPQRTQSPAVPGSWPNHSASKASEDAHEPQTPTRCHGFILAHKSPTATAEQLEEQDAFALVPCPRHPVRPAYPCPSCETGEIERPEASCMRCWYCPVHWCGPCKRRAKAISAAIMAARYGAG